MKFLKTITISILVFITSCNETEVLGVNVSNGLKKYVETFFFEADKLGIKLPNSSNISVKFHNEDRVSYCLSGTVWIRKKGWDNKNELEKELEVFHELGHCLLNRSHYNCQLEDGYSKSIMCGAAGTCGLDCQYSYRGIRREYYIKELFVENTIPLDIFNIAGKKDELLFSKKEKIYEVSFSNLENINFNNNSVRVEKSDMIFEGKSSTINFKNQLQSEFIADNFEIETTFEIQNGILSFNFGIPSNKESQNIFIFTLNKNNSLISFSTPQNITRELKDLKNDNNVLIIRKIGKMIYYYLNSTLIYQQDIIPTIPNYTLINNQQKYWDLSISTPASGTKSIFKSIVVNKLKI
jgi:hypothetical protein